MSKKKQIAKRDNNVKAAPVEIPPFLGRLDVTHATYQSPFPSIDDIERYEKIVPGAANRILEYVEKEQSMREGRIRKVYQLNSRGQLIACIVIIASIVGSVISACFEETAVGTALAGVSGTLGYLLFHDKTGKP